MSEPPPGRLVLQQRIADGEAVHVGQSDVKQHEFRRERPSKRDRRGAVHRLTYDVEALSLEQRVRAKRPEAGVVVDDQNGRAATD